MHLRYDDVLAELRKAVDIRGEDYVYPVEWRDGRYSDSDDCLTGYGHGLCKYVVDGAPACIVGQVLAQLGADLESLDGSILPAVQAMEKVGITLDEDAKELITIAQDKQDSDYPWGKAVSVAIEATVIRKDVSVDH